MFLLQDTLHNLIIVLLMEWNNDSSSDMDNM